MVVLITNNVLSNKLTVLFLDTPNISSKALATGVMSNAYLVSGVMIVVYIAIFELIFSVGRLKVICEFTFCPYIMYPVIATVEKHIVPNVKHITIIYITIYQILGTTY